MDHNRWPQIKALFEEALEISSSERAAFLEKMCAGDDTLRAEVESLLASDEVATDFLNTPAVVEDGPAPDLSRLGERIGPYRITRELGRGGMGAVYLAERADGAFQQTVALKVVRRGLDTDDILSRFTYERQILAALDHPHIAHLYDGGTTDDGRPYFAMEYVDGLPLTDYCDQNRLSTRQRLALFRTVCRVVQYAHQNLIVHRDLKPGNILVTDDGTVKLLDFGIAKLLSDNARGRTMPRTRTGMRLMTPEYASPEQIKGETITTAADIYQLGVLLYELLTGRRPYRLVERVHHEIERVILEEEPTRPSTAVGQVEEVRQGDQTSKITPETVSQARSMSVEALRRGLAGDLDNIVLMALKKDPAGRYASVEQLAEDLRRHLAGLPVVARKDTVGYRMSKFVRRHKAGVAAAMAFVVLLIGFAGAMAWQQAETARQRDRAQTEVAKADQINSFLQEMLRAVDPHEDGRDVTVAEVLDKAAQQVETDLADQPEIEAAVRRTIGLTYQNLGVYDEAEMHLRRALALRRARLGPTHPEVAQSLKDFALIKHWQSALDTAAVYYQQALTLFRARNENTVEFAEALNDYALLFMDQGDYEASEALLREALSINRTLHGDEDLNVASNLVNLALARHWLNDVEAADTLYRQGLAIQQQVGGAEYIEVAYALNNLGWVYLDKGDLAGADSLFRASLAIRRKNLGDLHPSVSLALHNLAAQIYFPQGDYIAADTLLREALRISRQVVPGDHLYTANSLYALAKVRVGEGKLREAEALFREALMMRTNLLGASNPLVSGIAVDLGGVLIEQGRYAEAEALLQPALADLDVVFHDRVSEALQRLVDLYTTWGRPEQADMYRARLTATGESQSLQRRSSATSLPHQ